MAAGLAATYHYVPNTRVSWGHAITGGLFASVALEAAKKVLAVYLKAVPTYSMVYGAFATFPILLIWIYTAWVIVLLGAVICAYLPSLLTGVTRRPPGPGWRFHLALEVIGELARVRINDRHGLTLMQLTEKLRVDPLQIEMLVEVLVELDWVGRLNENDPADPPRLVLLADPDLTPLAPLLARTLLPRDRVSEGFWLHSGATRLTLRDALLNS